MTRAQLLIALSLQGLCCFGIRDACAQQADQSEGSKAQSAAQSGQIEEIIVTAERRSERLQDVPLAVSVLTEAAAAKLGNFDNMTLGTQVPSFQASRQVTGATLYLRGIGTVAAPGVENAVATYVDDVYIHGFSSTIVAFNNIDRVEVLKGPQGTLFGRNATGGVIHIVTKDPSSDPALNIQAGYANYNTLSTNVYGTTGLGQHFAVDFAYASREQRDGYGVDTTTGQDINLGKEYGVRGKLKWTPNERTTAVLALDHYWDNYDYGSNQTVVPGTYSAGLGTFAGNYSTQGDNPYSPYGPGRSGHDRHVDGQALTFTYDFGGAVLKSVTAHRVTNDFTAYDQDGGPGHFNDARWPSETEQFSQELHIASAEGAQIAGRGLHWLAGVYYLRMRDGIALSTSGGLLGGGQLYVGSGTNYTHSYSAFVDGTLELTPGTNLTLGFRQTRDRIENHSETLFVTGDGTPFTTEFPDQTAKESKPTYRAILDHKFGNGVMAYLSASRGFKSGGFSTFGPGTPPTKPEIVDAYAIGMKSDWLDQRLQVNAEAFDYDYKNQQVQVIEAGGVVGVNAAASRIYGLELNVTALATPELQLFANLAYLHGRYRSFENAPVYLQSPATCEPEPQRLPGPLEPGNILCAIDASGKPTTRSPEFSGNIGFDYTVAKGTAGSFNLTGNYYYTSKYNWDPSGQFPEPAYGLLSTSVVWTAPSGKFDVQLYCTNCADKYHSTFISESGPSQQQAPADPRLYGIRFGYHFSK